MSAPDPLITRLERLGPDEWRPEPPPAARPAPRGAGDSEAPPRADAAAAAGPRRRPAPAGRSAPAVRWSPPPATRIPAARWPLAPLRAAPAATGKVRDRPHGRPRDARRLGPRAQPPRRVLRAVAAQPARRSRLAGVLPGRRRRPRDARGARAGRPLPLPLRRRLGRVRRRRSVALLALRPARSHLSWVWRARTLDRGRLMQRIVVAAKAGADQPWLADAAAELAQQTGAAVSVVSLDGLDVEALSPTPRSEFRELAETTVNGFVERLARRRHRGRGRRPRRARASRESCSTPRRRTPT